MGLATSSTQTYVTRLSLFALLVPLAYQGLPITEHKYCAVLLYPGEG